MSTAELDSANIIMPRSAQQLDQDWLAQVLSQKGIIKAGSLQEIRKQSIGVGEGFLAELVRVELIYNQPQLQQISSLIAKFASPIERTRDFAQAQNFYGREIGFYKDIGDDAGISTAQCYYLEHDEIDNYFVLLIEDLSPAVAADQIAGCDRQTSKLVIENVAAMHAKWWNSEKLTQLSWTQPVTEGGSLEEGRKILQDSLKKAQQGNYFDRYPNIKSSLKLLPALLKMEPPPPYPFTLSHGDLRADNVLNKGPDGGRFAMIDWQLCCRDQPVRDLARWLVQSITVEQRRETEMDLLALYHKCIVEHGITDYSFKKLKSDYQLSIVVMLLMFAGGMDDIDTSPERAEALMHSMYARLDTALVDWKVKPLLQALPYILPFMKLGIWLRMLLGGKA